MSNRHFSEIKLQLGKDLYGRLVFFNKSMDDTDTESVKDETDSIEREHKINDLSANSPVSGVLSDSEQSENHDISIDTASKEDIDVKTETKSLDIGIKTSDRKVLKRKSHEIRNNLSANSPVSGVLSASDNNENHDISIHTASEEDNEVRTETGSSNVDLKKSERKIFKRKCQCCEGNDDSEIAQIECKKKKETDFEIWPKKVNTNLTETWILGLGLSIREKHNILSGQCLNAKIIGAAMRRIQYLNSWYSGLEPIVNRESIWQRCYKRQKGQIIQILSLYQFHWVTIAEFETNSSGVESNKENAIYIYDTYRKPAFRKKKNEIKYPLSFVQDACELMQESHNFVRFSVRDIPQTNKKRERWISCYYLRLYFVAKRRPPFIRNK